MAGNNSFGPCPFIHRCGHAAEDCTEERSNTCEVISKTTPAPPKDWNPLEPVAIPLTREQWRDISLWLQYCIDWHRCRMFWWAHCCNDKKEGARIAAQHEATIKAHENVLKIIEEATREEQ